MLIIFSVAIVILITAFLFFLFYKGESKITEVSFVGKDAIVSAEIAKTPAAMMSGLMYRDLLPENQGMLFVFPIESRQSFWMKNVKFPLDIIFISKNKKIVDIKKDFKPCVTELCESYLSEKPTKYVLEVNAGFVEKWNINVGDEVKF